MKNVHILLALALSMTLAGCAVGRHPVGPNYAKPPMNVAPFHNLNSTHAAASGLPAPKLDTWWTGFDDPVLVTVVQRVLEQNLDLAAALERVTQARGAAAEAGAQLLPTADLEASVTAQRQTGANLLGVIGNGFPGYRRNLREYTIGPAASWEIDLSGGLRRGKAAALDEVQAAEADHVGTRITIAAEAADAYVQVREFQARLAVAQQLIDTDAGLLKLVEARRRAGAADGREVAQAEALLKEAKTTVPPLRVQLEAQLNRLDVLMGAQPGTYAKELMTPGKIPEVPAIGDADQPLDVLRRRPDIIAAERRLAAWNERIGVAISDYYPKISLSGALGFDSINAGTLFNGQAFQAIGGGALRWRLFDFGKVKAEIAQARLEQLEDEVGSLTRARDLSQRAYKAGAITLTDVLDADRQLLVARNEVESTRADAARAAVGTFRALGGGWDVRSNPSLSKVK
jgi:NodT family efflux transporter outer membrane factor (OMF) lipoprotein